MDIYQLLSSKPHNSKFLKRYIRYIEKCKLLNETITRKSKNNPNGTYMESHHIAPKARDLFPEYALFRNHPWNKIELTLVQHFTAHILLWKTYGGSQTQAIERMCNNSLSDNGWEFQKLNIGVKLFKELKEEAARLISQRSLGNTNSLGKKYWYNESLDKAIQLNAGEIPTEEGWVMRGRPIPQEQRERTRKTLTGRRNPQECYDRSGAKNRGSKRTPEQCENYRKAALNRTDEHNKKVGALSKGRKHYIHPDLPGYKRFIPGTEPKGYILGYKSKKTKSNNLQEYF